MNRIHLLALLALTSAVVTACSQNTVPNPRAGGAASPDISAKPKDWIDPDTGHHVWRLSVENASSNLYFHYNAYSADKKKVVFNSPSGIMAADLATKHAELIVPGVTKIMETSRVANDVFYVTGATGPNNLGGTIMAANIDTKQIRPVVKIPSDLSIACVNADATLFAGVILDAPNPEGNDKSAPPDKIASEDQLSVMFAGKKPEDITAENRLSAEKENGLAKRLNAVLKAPNPRCLFTLNAKTGEVKKFGYAYAWLNHLQFSPTDPSMLQFCHEGTWHETIRVWTINVSDPKPVAKAMHQRSMPMEIWGHEWWAPDGKSVGFDLQMPRSGAFFIAKVPLAPGGGPGTEIRFPLDKNWWGIHFAMSQNGSMYASDGGDPGQVSFAPDGMWINLLRVTNPNGGPNSIAREKLVNMKQHDYVTSASVPGHTGVEPNVTFTPDDKYIIFGGTFEGSRHVYMVEVAKGR